MKYDRKVFKWMVIVGCVPATYFSFIKRVVGIDDPCYPFWYNFFIWLGISVAITLVMSFFVFHEINWLEKKLPWKKRPAFRILAELPIVLGTTSFLMLFFSHLTYNLHNKSFGHEFYNSYADFLAKELTMCAVLTLIVVSVVESTFFFKEWRKSLVLSERLQKENMQSQLEVLKNQVNPHFLFNSLNVLSSLVYSDPSKAEMFIDKFASVYRYILNIQGKIVVQLNEELEFLNSYIYLQKIRFNEGFIININIEENKLVLYIPPLCLQQLVENAIKHNIVSAEHPLTVKIYNEGNELFVINNIQKRDEPQSSTGIGLKNLTERYFQFANVKPKFEEKENQFIAMTPLLKITNVD